MKLDSNKGVSQTAFAELVGITQPAISEMISSGRLPAAGSFSEWLAAYCANLRERAAGRDESLAVERSRLAREQADRIALQNAVTRRELAPVALLEEVLARVSSEIAGLLESIPAQIKRQNVSLTAHDIELLERVIGKARNAAAAAEINLDDLKDDLGTDSESDPVGA